jgi:hypothetical protein
MRATMGRTLKNWLRRWRANHGCTPLDEPRYSPPSTSQNRKIVFTAPAAGLKGGDKALPAYKQKSALCGLAE